MCAKSTINTDSTVEDKLDGLFALQLIDSEIDKINFIKGELPIEVQDMEDEIEGLNTRMTKLNEELKEINDIIIDKNRIKEESKNSIEKLEKQQNSVKNNREFESISKEIELAKLEIELSDKKIKDNSVSKDVLNRRIEEATAILDAKIEELKIKRGELDVIEDETNQELAKLEKESAKAKAKVDERLLKGYSRIRKTYRNGLAIISIDRDSCGGCYAKIPPQKQLEIKQRKKVLVCENCGRIFCYPKDLEVIDQEKLVEEIAKPVKRSRSKRAK